MTRNTTVFGKILRGELPARMVYEDEEVVAFHDINPQAPVHILIIPRVWLKTVDEAGEEHERLLGHLLRVAAQVARQVGIDKTGYRLVINHGEHGQQSVFHLHVHLLGGRQFRWPPG